MSGQPNRLAADAAHGFGGIELDRTRPLSFRLNGRRIEGFFGDTVLTATLASGIDTVGTEAELPLALDARFAPPLLARDKSNTGTALPMDRTPALDGVDYDTLAPGGARRSLRRPAPTLGHRFDTRALELPWLRAAPEATLNADLVVVGGGVAGLSAAEAGIAAGRNVVLIERRPWLGGDARYFGPMDNDESPEAFVARLQTKLSAAAKFRLLPRTDVFEINGTTLLAHQVETEIGVPRGRVIAIAARHIVLATGSLQRLPVFAGNRRPGIVTSMAAYHRAKRYGVWRGKHAIIATQSNFSYRLALRINDAGIAIQRIVDSRLNPQSRFVDFSKASGFTLSSSLVAIAAGEGKRGEMSLRIRGAGGAEQTVSMPDGQIVVSGAWQPDLALWMRAGGALRWNEASGKLEPQGGREAIVLAGAVAGLITMKGCVASGQSAVAGLLGRPPVAVDDTQIDAAFETSDAITPIAPPQPLGRAYLDGGSSLIVRHAAEAEGSERWSALNEARALSLGDVAASVQLRLIEPADAGIIADERGAAGGEITAAAWQVPAETDEPFKIPNWLAGRFGADPVLAVVVVDGKRRFETGALIYSNTVPPDPAEALGVIVGPAPDNGPGGLALLSQEQLTRSDRFIIRTATGPAPLRIVRRLDLTPAA